MSALGVTVGGETAVDTSDLTSAADRLDAVRDRLHDHAVTLALPPLAGGPSHADDTALGTARHLLDASADAAQTLAADLRRAAEEYADGERVIGSCVPGSGEAGAYQGAAAPGAWGLVTLAPRLVEHLGALGSLLGDVVANGGDEADRVMLPGVIRETVSDVDRAVRSELPGLPTGDDGTREATAALLAVAGGLGLLRDGPARIRLMHDTLRPAPTGYGDLAARVPDPVDGSPQTRVEQYRVPDGSRRFVVYLGGIESTSPVAGEEDWDLTSAGRALATEGGSAVEAAKQALRDAGVTAGDEVCIVGYSMGGIVTRSIGDDPAFHVTHEVTFGSPIEQLPLRNGADGVSLEHTDDLVPALGGTRPSGAASGDEIVVRTRSSTPSTTPGAVAAHMLPEYRATAREMDASRSPQLVQERARIRGFLDGATPVESRLYRAEREG